MRKLAFAAVSTLVLGLTLALIFPAPRHAIAQGVLSYVVGLVGGAAPTSGIQVAGSDGTNLRALKVASDGTVATTSTAVGAVANDTTAVGLGLETQPAIAVAAPTAVTAGRSEKLQVLTTNGGVLAGIVDSASTRQASVFFNDTTAVNNGIEALTGVARATPTATTAGRAQLLQQSTTNGGLFSALVGGSATTVVDAFANDTTAAGNGLQVHPGIAKAGPTAITAGRSELLELDTVTGGQYVVEAATTSATGLTTTGITTVTASQSIKGSAGNLYGFGVVNGAGAGCWLQCVNSATAGTLGTAVIFQAPLPTSATAYSAPGPIPLGTFSTGIACGVASAVNGASACGTAATGVAIYYK